MAMKSLYIALPPMYQEQSRLRYIPRNCSDMSVNYNPIVQSRLRLGGMSLVVEGLCLTLIILYRDLSTNSTEKNSYSSMRLLGNSLIMVISTMWIRIKAICVQCWFTSLLCSFVAELVSFSSKRFVGRGWIILWWRLSEANKIT